MEHGRDYEVYSNGLRIENRFLAPNEPRSYVIFRNGSPSERRSKPAGIIFHTSENAQVPFAANENETLTRIGRDLLEYISRKQAYHFVVDRFGRVFRIVPETDVANHAGNSVWADRDGVYLNLNHSFLGVSFEAHTRDLNEGVYLNASQIHSGHLLVEMLVSKYDIPLTNCVTHAAGLGRSQQHDHRLSHGWVRQFSFSGTRDSKQLRIACPEPVPFRLRFRFSFPHVGGNADVERLASGRRTASSGSGLTTPLDRSA